MKLWKLQIIWGEEKHRTVLIFDRNLSRLDVERITKYINGGFHVHANPRKREKKVKAPPLTADDLQNLLKEDENSNLFREDEKRHLQIFNVAPPKIEEIREGLDRNYLKGE